VVPPLNIQSVANIPIQSAANIPLANYQPSTPYVYPDPPATPTPGTTPEGTENTFFAENPDKYTVPTPFSYGTTTPPPPPPGTPPPPPPGTPPPPDPWTPSPGWTIGADGNISLDESTAPTRYFSQDEEGEDVFNQQKFLQDAYNNQLFQGNPNYQIEETVEEDQDGNEHRTYSFVRTPTTAAPTTAAPTTAAPTTVAPTTVAPTTVAPTTVAPPTVAPPTVAPPTVAPPTVAPPTVAPPTVAPPTVAPPTWTPSPGWIRRPDGNISLDKASAPAKYWKQEDDDAGGDEWFDTQWFLQDAYNNKRLEKRLSAAGYRIDEIVEEDQDGNEHSYFRLVRAGGPNWNDGGFVQRSGVPYTQGGNAMPNVMGREFPYTPEGMAAAQQYKQAIGMRDGGMMGFRPIGMQAGGIAEDDNAATMETYLSFQEALENKSSPTELNKFIYDNLSALKTMALGNSARAAQLADVMKQSGFEGYMRNLIQGAGQVPSPEQETLRGTVPPDTQPRDTWNPPVPKNPVDRYMSEDPPRDTWNPPVPKNPVDPYMSEDPRYKGYFNPNQVNPFFDPDEIEVANGGYITRNMNRGGLMSLRRR
jgi:hypothetical protein